MMATFGHFGVASQQKIVLKSEQKMKKITNNNDLLT